MSEDRIRKGIEDDESVTLSGDSGGKAELLRLLEATKQPSSCLQRYYGTLGAFFINVAQYERSFPRHLMTITFDRVSDEALRRIARRVLREEDIDYTNDAIDVLVKEIMVIYGHLYETCSTFVGGLKKLNPELVREHLAAGVRDMTTEVFPGMESLYRSEVANDAVTIGRSIDKQPSDLMNWVHWNNASLFDEVAMRRGSKALILADRSVESRYRDLAHHSSYWTLHLSSLSASVANNTPLPTRIYPSYPNYLRRSDLGASGHHQSPCRLIKNKQINSKKGIHAAVECFASRNPVLVIRTVLRFHLR